MTTAQRTCSVDGCEATHMAHGYCQKHYKRWKKTGTVDDRPLRHGLSAYKRQRCRCPVCTEAARTEIVRYRAKHTAQDSATARAYYEANRERITARNSIWAKANPERRQARARQRRQEDPISHRLAQHQRRARKLSGDYRDVTTRDWYRVCVQYQHRCAYCGEQKPLTQDHVIPLYRGGRHAIGNIVPACRSCNASKGPRLLVEWRRWQRTKT